jgi:DEAD/DEAH box helicase domain-containing protein
LTQLDFSMNLDQIVDVLQNDRNFMDCVSHWQEIPEQPAQYVSFPYNVDRRLIKALGKRGIEKPYVHQAEAIEKIISGENTVVVTPTASGKTLCYNVPVLNAILDKNESRALYLFPTKALSQDQIAELHQIVGFLGEDIDFEIKSYTFDGDTPQSARKAIRSAGHIVVTNPDMLHSGILPHHTTWVKLFENLRYIVIDEIHNYRGVFGSHLANVIRRLKRICKFYGSRPVFILCSATIANPLELAENIIGEAASLVDNNGAPRGRKIMILYNPPVVNKELGIRSSYIKEARNIAAKFLGNNIQTIVFARNKLRVEILVTYLKDFMKAAKKPANKIRGYRGGYLPLERREIEKGLRQGEILGVVSTNALELGIDIGQLQACVMAGYPGTIASTWQQAGRAGRRSDTSMAILVGSSAPLDQYIMNHPDYLFEKSPESGIIDSDNLVILLSHIKCAAFELPFETGELFGASFTGDNGVESTPDILSFLEENRVLHKSGDKWHWMAETYPAEAVSLRSAAEENVVIIDKTQQKEKVIGEIDLFAAQLFVHDDAIYIHESQQFHVDQLDWERRKAYVRQVQVDHYTDAQLKSDIKVLEISEEKKCATGICGYGEVAVTSLATMFKKIKFNTHENIGWGKIHLPEIELHTCAFWYSFSADLPDVLQVDQDAIGEGLKALANVFAQVAPLFIMGDPRDFYAKAMVRSPLNQLPSIFLWERYPGGVGYSKKLYHIYHTVADSAKNLIKECACESGCPSCVGPTLEVGKYGKTTAVKLLELMIGN